MFDTLVNPMFDALLVDNPQQLLVTALLIYCLAGIIKGTLGIGFPTAAVSLMAQFTDARSAIVMVIMPMLFTNIWQVIRSRELLSVIVQLKLLLSAMLIAMLIASLLATRFSSDVLAIVLGLITSAYALHSLYAKPLKIPSSLERQAQLIAGVSAGVMGGLISVWAPPILVYLSARQLSKQQFVATAGVILMSGSFLLLVSYLSTDSLSYGLFLCSMILVAPSLAGFAMGEYIRNRISAYRFQRLLLWFFFIMGLNLIRRVFQ